MDSDRWKRIEHVYHSVLDLEESRRSAFLEDTCGHDESLRREIESLLSAETAANSFLETPALEVLAKELAHQADSSDSNIADDLLLAGKTVSHYRVLEKLGGGGMGVVYRAEDLKLGRHVALKFLPRQLADHPDAIAQLRGEARAASALNHPHICTVHDIDEFEAHPFIVMELLHGETLKQRIAGQPLRQEAAIAFAAQIVDALEAAHANGIIHRDIKPANIFITNRGDIKVLDFGLATISHSEATISETCIEKMPAFAGTLPYMAPEQLKHKPADERTDIYAFGASLFEMITGRRAFPQRSTTQLVNSVLHDIPSSPRTMNTDISPELEQIILKSLAKDPSQRFQSAKEVATELQRLLRAKKSSVALRLPIVAAVAIIVVAGMLIAVQQHWLTHPSATGSLQAATTRQITANPLDDPVIHDALSPDGMRVAYTDLQGLHLRTVETGETHSLPVPEGLCLR